MTERVVQASAAVYVMSPQVLGSVAPDPDRSPDRLSASWLVALGARQVAELGALVERAANEGTTLATLGIDAEITFSTAAQRTSFAAELAEAVDRLVERYQSDDGSGRAHRLVLGFYPKPTSKRTQHREEH